MMFIVLLVSVAYFHDKRGSGSTSGGDIRLKKLIHNFSPRRRVMMTMTTAPKYQSYQSIVDSDPVHELDI